MLNNSIARAVRILNVFTGQRSEIGLSEISREAGLHKSTVHRLLASLERAGFVEQSSENGKYRLGLKLFELGSLVMHRINLREEARPHLQALARKTKETVHLAALADGEIIYFEKIEGQSNLTIPSAIGRKIPAHCTGLGKVLLAHLPEEELEAIVRQKGLKRFTANTITSLGEFKKHLEGVRTKGYAIDNEECELGLKCVAAPVRNHTGSVVAAISIAGPSGRLRSAAIPRLSKLVMETAARISRQLGYPLGEGQKL